MMDSYNLLVETHHGIHSHYISSSIDLIDQYKTSIIQGKGYVMWEDGVIDCNKIIGITRVRAPKPQGGMK